MTQPRQTVLVVDDDPSNLALITELCLSLGFEADTAMDGEAALERVRECRPDLVLLDITMPKKTGFEVLQTLKADDATRDIPVIIVTAMADVDAKVKGIEYGATDYLTKPFKLIELQTRIRAALQVRHFQDRLRLAQEALASQNSVDPTTGASVFAQLHADLDYEVARARRYGRPLSTLFVGVDGVLGVQDEVGDERAAELLQEIVRAMQIETRNIDRICRLGDEEFVVLLPETDAEGASVVAERVQSRVAGLATDDTSVAVTIGMASFPHPRIRGGEDLLKAASDALKTAQRDGPGGLSRHE